MRDWVYYKYNSHNKHGKLSQYIILACSLIGLTTVSALTLLSSTVLADTSSVNTVSTTVPPSCSFTSASTSSYSATILNGQTSTITADPITATCNDTSGYAIYAIGYSGDTYTGDYHTDMISTLSNSYNIKTNGTNGSSYWKMKLQDLSNATIANSYDNFQTIPASLTKIASYTSNIQAGSFTPVYQIYIATTQAAGTYTGKVKYTLVHPNTMVAGTYTIAYNANGGTGTMSSNTNLYNFEEFTLPTSTITPPAGYAFAGWCTTNTAGSYACDGTSYAAGDKVTSLASAGSTATLYAYWEEIPKIYMQDQTTSFLTAMMPNEGDTATLTDKRDGHNYTVAKIGSLYWMTRNLDLPGGTTIYKTDSNITANSYTLPASSTSGFNDETKAFVYNSDSTNFNDTSCGNNNPCYSYYSYVAATAGTNPSSGEASSDICPKGWRLPTRAEFTTLKNSYNTGAKLVASSFLGVYAGFYSSSSFFNGGSNGYYWSSTADDASLAYALAFYSSYANVNLNDKNNGYSVRCVAKS